MQLKDVPSHYDRAARWYDAGRAILFDRLLHIEQEREHTIDLLGDLSGARVLDVGVGTGANLPFLVSKVGPSGSVLGVDYSQGMLARASARVESEGYGNVELMRGDAAVLEGVQGDFDVVISVWCLGIVHDLPAALARSLELLRPGGRLAIMDFRSVRPDHGWLNWFFPLYAPLLRVSGIDSREDLDAERYEALWRDARAWLDRKIDVLHEERYLADTGFILVGEKR